MSHAHGQVGARSVGNIGERLRSQSPPGRSMHMRDELDSSNFGCTNEVQDVVAGAHDDDGGSPTTAKMSTEDMRLLMEQDGLPLFVYNRYYYTESKRLMLNTERNSLCLVNNDAEDDFDVQS